MASYLANFWRSLTSTRPAFNEADFLDALRPRNVLHTPRRLPTSPTRSHLPARRPDPRDTGKKSKQCPHCRKTFYVELPAGRISKPKTTRDRAGKGRKGKGQRWISVGDVYRVEDLSPTLARGAKSKGVHFDASEKSFQAGKPKARKSVRNSTRKGRGRK